MNSVIAPNETKVFFKKSGYGQALILIHGFCADHRIWDDLALHLKNNFTLYLPDLPGYGKSEMGNTIQSIELFADVIEAIIKAEHLENIIVAGHSMGGYVLCELLHRKNKTIDKGIFINSHPFADTAEKIKNREKSNAFVERNGGSLYVKELYKNLFASSNTPKESEIVDKFKHIFSDLNDNTIVQSNNAMIQREGREKALAETDVPLQFIIGAEDAVIDLNTSLKQCYLPSVSDVQVLKKTGHLAMVEKTALLAEKINSFANYERST